MLLPSSFRSHPRFWHTTFGAFSLGLAGLLAACGDDPAGDQWKNSDAASDYTGPDGGLVDIKRDASSSAKPPSTDAHSADSNPSDGNADSSALQAKDGGNVDDLAIATGDAANGN